MDVPGRRGDGEQTPIVYEETRKEKDSSMTRLHAFEMWKLNSINEFYCNMGCSLRMGCWAAVYQGWDGLQSS